LIFFQKMITLKAIEVDLNYVGVMELHILDMFTLGV
jgi:hypothetical protein